MQFGFEFNLPSREDNDSEVWCLEKENYHPNDYYVSFDEIPHKYYHNDVLIAKSVTQFVDGFFEKFEGRKVAVKMMNGMFWPRNEYMYSDGTVFSLEEVLERWNQVGMEARNRGIIPTVHCYISLFISDL